MGLVSLCPGRPGSGAGSAHRPPGLTAAAGARLGPSAGSLPTAGPAARRARPPEERPGLGRLTDAAGGRRAASLPGEGPPAAAALPDSAPYRCEQPRSLPGPARTLAARRRPDAGRSDPARGGRRRGGGGAAAACPSRPAAQWGSAPSRRDVGWCPMAEGRGRGGGGRWLPRW